MTSFSIVNSREPWREVQRFHATMEEQGQYSLDESSAEISLVKTFQNTFSAFMSSKMCCQNLYSIFGQWNKHPLQVATSLTRRRQHKNTSMIPTKFFWMANTQCSCLGSTLYHSWASHVPMKFGVTSQTKSPSSKKMNFNASQKSWKNIIHWGMQKSFHLSSSRWIRGSTTTFPSTE